MRARSELNKLSGDASFAAMVQAANLRNSYNPAHARWLNRLRFWRLFVQGQMRSRSVIVVGVGSECSTERGVVEHNQMIQAFSPNRTSRARHRLAASVIEV